MITQAALSTDRNCSHLCPGPRCGRSWGGHDKNREGPCKGRAALLYLGMLVICVFAYNLYFSPHMAIGKSAVLQAPSRRVGQKNACIMCPLQRSFRTRVETCINSSERPGLKQRENQHQRSHHPTTSHLAATTAAITTPAPCTSVTPKGSFTLP